MDRYSGLSQFNKLMEQIFAQTASNGKEVEDAIFIWVDGVLKP